MKESTIILRVIYRNIFQNLFQRENRKGLSYKSYNHINILYHIKILVNSEF